MSRNQLARTPDNFPRMKWRAAGRLLGPGTAYGPRRGGTYTGGYRCPEHGIKWDWTDVSQAEQDEIDRDIADHEAMHDDDDPYADFPIVSFTDDPEGRALVAKIHERKRATQ